MVNFSKLSNGCAPRAAVDTFNNVKVSYTEFLNGVHTTVSQIDLGSLNELFENVFQNVSEEGTNLALSVMSLFYRMYRLETLTDLFFAALDFLKSVFGVNYIVDSAKFCFDFIRNNIVHLYNKLILLSPITESSVHILKDMKSKMNVVLNSEIVSAIRDFVLALVTFRMFSRETATKITRTIGPAKPASVCELAEVCLSSAIAVVNFSTQISQGCTLSEIFCNKDPTATFMSISDELDSLRDLTYSGLPVDGKVCRREYLSRVAAAVKDGESILDSLPRHAPQRRGIEFSLKKVRLIKSQFINMMTAESRPMPFSVCLEGMPGIGKGLLVDYVSMIWSNVKGREFDHTHVYHRQATEEYWSGYEPASKPIIHYSEPGSLNRNIAKARGDPVMTEFLSVADNQPYMCNMADVESKGKVYALPEFLVMDCNDPTMNLDVLVNNPAAVRRRILYITPIVKKEFVQEGTCRMDQAKSLASETPKLDRWNFTVYKMEPQNCKESATIKLLDNASIFELSDFLRDIFRQHIEQQESRCNILAGENIEDYFSKVSLESNDITPPTPVRRDFEFASVKFFETTLEIFWFGLIAMFWLNVTVFTIFAAVFVWLWPQNFFFKIASLIACKSRISYSLDQYNYWWNLFRASIGLSNNYNARPPPSYKMMKYVAVLSGLLLLMKGFRTMSYFTEGSIVSSQRNWSEEEVDRKISEFEVSSKCNLPPPRSKKGNGIDWESVVRPSPVLINQQEQKNEADKIVSTVSKNVRIAQIHGRRVIETRVLGLFEDYALVNRHSVCHDKNGVWNAVIKVNEEHEVGVVKCQFDEDEMCQVDGDIWLLRLRGAKFRDIRSYFATDYVSPAIYGNVGYIGGQKVMVKPSSRIVAQDKNWGPVPVDKPLAYQWDQHAVGLCGTPLIMEYSGGRGVVGIHIAGSHSSTAYSQSIRLDDIIKALNSLEETTCSLGVNSEGKLRLPAKVEKIGPVTERSPLRWEQVAGLSIYGGLFGYRPMKLGKSKVLSTAFIHHAKDLVGVSPFKDGKPLYASPPFTPGFNPNTGEYQAPYNHFVKKCGVIKESLHPKILRKTIDMVTKHIITNLRQRGVTTLSPVTMEVAQNGSPDDFYMRSMKPSTSGGWPWPGAKKKYSRECCLDFKKDAYMPLFDVKEQVVEQLSAYQRGEDALPLLGAQLKDEPRAYKKVVDRKTRVFCMSPYESTLVNRMYLMPFYTLMVEHGDIFCSSIGINMHSEDVGDLVNRMTEFSDKFMEGDYGGYDTSMPYDIGLAANSVVYNVCKNINYDAFALNMIKGILSDNLYPTVVLRGDVFAAPALQPSGKYATAEDNSLRGLILLVYAWISECTQFGHSCTGMARTTKFTPEDFFIQVCPVIYGDDMLAGVKPEAQHFFNNNNYQRFCKTVYGLDFTNAKKTLEMSNFLEFSDTSFLKRKFVFREDLKVWVAQLELESIMKSICYYLPSKSVSKDDQLIDSCTSALRELFFHLEEDEYHIRRLKFAQICADMFGRDVEDILKVFPPFGSIKESIYGKSLPWL